ncbi:MAG TPA: DUF3667 domain-containing protein [Vicinamibacterales bacterium]|nr:DUF3667 domain-containing protein [Vicinamibacterales bacterium]
MASCANCGVALGGEYCHACGQRAIDDDELTVAHALKVGANEVLHLESKTLRTMARLFVPGALTEAYLAGHRAPYTSPLKLYLACAAIFFLCAPFAGYTLQDLLEGDTGGALKNMVNAETARSGLTPEHFAERFNLRFQTVYTLLLFVAMLGSAVMLALLFRRQHRPFGTHVVFELHYVSFLYLSFIALGLALRPFPLTPLLSILSAFAVFGPYMFLALRRVYGEPTGRTLWKTVVMLLFAMVFDNLINFVALVLMLKLI